MAGVLDPLARLRRGGATATQRNPISSAVHIGCALFGCLILYLVCSSTTNGGDTLRYAGDVVYAHAFTKQWTYVGHLLWRPWGYLGLRFFGSEVERIFGDTPIQAVARFLIWTNFVCSAAIVVLMWRLFRQIAHAWLATLMTIAFFGANCFLNYSMLGTAYLPALLFEILTLWLLIPRSPERTMDIRRAAAAGVAFAICVALWLPYICSAAGLLAVIFLWPGAGFQERHSIALRRATVFVLAFSAACLLLFGGGALASGVTSIAGLRKWIVESENGWSQNRNLLRAATGLPRALFELGGDTMSMKRRLFHDPYNPVSVFDVLGRLGLKLALFYAGCLAIVVVLIRERSARWMFHVLLAAAVPLLFFAIVLFEPSSPERYLPLLPFFYLAALTALQCRRRKLAAVIICALLISAPLFNVSALASHRTMRLTAVRNRRADLLKVLKSPATVYTVSFDDFYWLPSNWPLDHTIAPKGYDLQLAVESATVATAHWRSEFARHTLDYWNQGHQIWLSERLLHDKPLASWGWVEGDDPRVHWKDLPRYFRQFDFDVRSSPNSDGFLLLSHNAKNTAILTGSLEQTVRAGRKPSGVAAGAVRRLSAGQG